MTTTDDTTTPQTDDLNLDLNFDDLPKVEAPVDINLTTDTNSSVDLNAATEINSAITTDTANDLYPVKEDITQVVEEKKSEAETIPEIEVKTEEVTPVLDMPETETVEEKPTPEVEVKAEEVTPVLDIPETETVEEISIPEVKVKAEEVTPKLDIPETVEEKKPEEDRLKKEDEIVEQKENIIEEQKKEIPENNIKEENLPSGDLKSDEKIIEDLTSTTTVPKAEDMNLDLPIEPEKIETPAEPTASVFNLDNLVGDTPVVEQITTPIEITTPTQQNITPSSIPEQINQIPQQTNIEAAPTIPAAPAQEIVTPQIPTAPIPTTPTEAINTPIQTEEKTHKSGGKVTSFVVLIGLILAGGYILKTMYPLEYNSLKANVTSIFQSQTKTQTNPSLEAILEYTGATDEEEIYTGEDLYPLEDLYSGEDTLLIYDNTGVVNENTTLPSTPGFDGFSDLEGILTGDTNTALESQNQLTQLQDFADKAKAFVALGTKINDKLMLKYSTYVYKKATSLVQSIENNEEIDNSKIDSYLTQFSGYLEQLTTLSYEEEIATPEPENITGDQTDNMIQDIMIEDITGPQTTGSEFQISEIGS